MRDVNGRIRWFLSNNPSGPGMCAEHVWRALDVRLQGLPDATAVYRKALPHGIHAGPAPRGAIHYWTGGAAGHGHVGIANDWLGNVASVDVNGGGTVGVRSLAWFRATWPALDYKGWSWWWGDIDTYVKEKDMRVVIKRETDQRLELNRWQKLDLRSGAGNDKIQPPIGNNDWDTYVNLDLSSVTGASRNDLRYILGRWARHDPDSTDTINMEGREVDVTGADTKAIPPDLPKKYWRSTWTHGFVGEKDVPVSFWVYIGSVKDGYVTSPLRIFKVDDES